MKFNDSNSPVEDNLFLSNEALRQPQQNFNKSEKCFVFITYLQHTQDVETGALFLKH